MLFSSPIFLFLFLPVVLLAYYLTPRRAQNFLLFVASLAFFAWGGVSYSLLILFSIGFNYLFGKKIAKHLGVGKAKTYLLMGVSINLIFLGIFKYADFIIGNINLFSDILLFKPLGEPGLILPIGISFYTFQAISYLVDVYRREAAVQQNPFNLGLYIVLFPQLIAGPIVRYHDIAQQIISRVYSIPGFVYGVKRFVLGLGKKVLLANNMGIIADIAFDTPAHELNTGLAWIGLIAYSLQIYLDFSGYSDMAIGLGRMFGFSFLENFNYPYISRSIRDFWRRWHISLSSWFRDYLYIPLGGNRATTWRTYTNLLIVFFVTGLWHGASWSFVIWGFIHGVFLIIERISHDQFPNSLWRPLQHVYTLIVVMMAWVFFRADNLGDAFAYYQALFGLESVAIDLVIFNRILANDFILYFALSILSASGALVWAGKHYDSFAAQIRHKQLFVSEFLIVLKHLGIATVLIMCAVYLITNTYNPFIYYRF